MYLKIWLSITVKTWSFLDRNQTTVAIVNQQVAFERFSRKMIDTTCPVGNISQNDNIAIYEVFNHVCLILNYCEHLVSTNITLKNKPIPKDKHRATSPREAAKPLV